MFVKGSVDGVVKIQGVIWFVFVQIGGICKFDVILNGVDDGVKCDDVWSYVFVDKRDDKIDVVFRSYELFG